MMTQIIIQLYIINLKGAKLEYAQFSGAIFK